MYDKPFSPKECRPSELHFILSGWKDDGTDFKHKNWFKLPYSSHSSPNELLKFVSKLKPKKVIYNCNKKHWNKDKGRVIFKKRLLKFNYKSKQKMNLTE